MAKMLPDEKKVQVIISQETEELCRKVGMKTMREWRDILGDVVNLEVQRILRARLDEPGEKSAVTTLPSPESPR